MSAWAPDRVLPDAGSRPREGLVVLDVATLFDGPLIAPIYDQLGIVQQRTGNRSANNAPRNTYRTADDRWVAVSTSTQSVAERVLRLGAQPGIVDKPWFATGTGRAAHADLLDELVAAWISERPLEHELGAFEEAEAAVAPIYDVSDVLRDPQYQALETITTVADPELGRPPGSTTCGSDMSSELWRSCFAAARRADGPTRRRSPRRGGSFLDLRLVDRSSRTFAPTERER